ncbi:MAG TPA: flagellum-specific ATP synthase FliI, partial [Accumulibacter sp.]|nr:flagellum-specific ATP synthase FliI [Accumulibacter sp.]
MAQVLNLTASGPLNNASGNPHLDEWRSFLEGCRQVTSQVSSLLPSGHLTRINGLVMEASGLKLPLGSSCRIMPVGGSAIEAEVVGFNGERL